MTCSTIGRLLSRYVDAELPRERRDEVDSHLAGCDACRWSVTLLEREDRAIAEALRGPTVRAAASSGARRVAAVAAVALVLLGGTLALLHRAYTGVADGTTAAVPRAVLVRAKAVPLPEFLARLSEASGVSVSLEAGESPAGLIDFELVEPIALGSVLALLEEFHGLRHRVEDGRILIRREREQP